MAVTRYPGEQVLAGLGLAIAHPAARWLSVASMALALATACGDDSEQLAPKPTICIAGATLALEAISADVTVHLDAPASPGMDLVKADLGRYLSELWGRPVSVASGAPDAGVPVAIWLSTSDAARDRIGKKVADGFALRRLDDGGRTTFVVYAPDAQNLAYGAYAFLEELGVRFFHPNAELVPKYEGARLPAALNVTRKPAWRIRGMQEHTLHPIETMTVLNEPGAENLAEAKRYVDWLVKTGQNLVQWPLMDLPFAPFQKHAQAIADYAHARGVKVGASVVVFGKSALQDNFVLIKDTNDWQAELESRLATLLEVDWDVVELTLGEFIAEDPGSVVTWLDHATAHVATNHPEVEVSVSVHVGNYSDLWVDYQGKKTFFYHLAGITDTRLTSSVHTVAFFDLYRPWGTYAHDDFFLQKDYLFGELGERKVRYFPESAYWIGADVDVPQFFPMYAYARWLDISSLSRDIRDKKLPPLDGHVLFSSGREWGYWLNDYATAKAQWNPDGSFQELIGHVTGVFGDCAPDVTQSLEGLIAIQNEYLFDRRLVAYVQGEDTVLDMGYLAGIESHPKRKPFQEVAAMAAGELDAFEKEVIGGLTEMNEKLAPLETAVARRCANTDDTLAPWCSEWVDGFAIDRLRAEHSIWLYRAVIDLARGGSSHGSHLARARKVTAQAAKVIARREQGYRYPVSRLTAAYENPTSYDFGYLRQAHTSCFWERQDLQVEILLTEGVAAPVSQLPTCLD